VIAKSDAVVRTISSYHQRNEVMKIKAIASYMYIIQPIGGGR